MSRECVGCHEIKPYQSFSPERRNRDGREHCCRACINRRRKSLRAYKGRPLGRCVDCGGATRGMKRCTRCRQVFQAQAEFRSSRRTVGPGECPISVPGGICGERLLDGTDRLGRAVTWCIVHGERVVPIHRPVDFQRYSQRTDLEAKMGAAWESVQKMPKRRGGKAGRSWEKNFTVIGRALADKIELA